MVTTDSGGIGWCKVTSVGIDLSLTSTGLCVLDTERTISRIVPDKLRGFERVHYIVAAILAALPPADELPAIFIEGYSFGSKGRAIFDIAECGGIVRWELGQHGYTYTDVPPASLKKWATSKGNADKGLMLATAIRKYDYEGSSHDEADALLLAYYGRDA